MPNFPSSLKRTLKTFPVYEFKGAWNVSESPRPGRYVAPQFMIVANAEFAFIIEKNLEKIACP